MKERNATNIFKMLIIILSGIIFIFGTDILMYMEYSGSLLFEMDIISFGFFMGSSIIYTIDIAVKDTNTPENFVWRAVYAILSIAIGMLMGVSVIWMSVQSSGVLAFVVLIFAFILGIIMTTTLLVKTVI